MYVKEYRIYLETNNVVCKKVWYLNGYTHRKGGPAETHFFPFKQQYYCERGYWIFDHK